MHEIPEAVYQEVKATYSQNLSMPVIKPGGQYLLCPVGLVGSGKTTVVKPLAEKLSLLRISSDDIRKLFHDRGYGYERTAELAFSLMKHYLAEGYSVAVDSDCASKIKELENFSQETGLKIIWVHINPPESFILHKLSNLTPNWLGTAEDMVQNYYDRKPLHANLSLPLTTTFDTSRGDLSHQVEDAVLTIKRATQTD